MLLCIHLQSMKIRINWDALGVVTSVACAIHCAILPLFIVSLPLFGINIIENHTFEIVMILLAFVIGIYALWHGYKGHHHRKLPIILFVAGISFLFMKEIWHDFHISFLVPAVLLIVSAHFLNFRFCRSHHRAHKEDCNHDHY